MDIGRRLQHTWGCYAMCRLLNYAEKKRYQWRLVSEQSPSRTPIHDSSEIREKWGHVPYMCMLSIGFHAICKDHWNCWQTVKFCLGMLILSVYEFLYLQKKKKKEKKSLWKEKVVRLSDNSRNFFYILDFWFKTNKQKFSNLKPVYKSMLLPFSFVTAYQADC